MSEAFHESRVYVGAFLLAIGTALAAASLSPSTPWLARALVACLATLPLGAGLAFLGAFGGPERRLAAAGGKPDDLLGGLVVCHLGGMALAVVALIAVAEGEPKALIGLTVALAFAGAGVAIVRGAWGPGTLTEVLVGAGAGAEAGADAAMAAGQAVRPRARYSLAGARFGLAALVVGLLLAALALSGGAKPAAAWLCAGTACALAGGGGGFARATGTPWELIVVTTLFSAFAVAGWLAAYEAGWLLVPFALALSWPQLRCAWQAIRRPEFRGLLRGP